jgi:hypothetical protein
MLNRILSFFPSRTPIGVQEFNKWSDDVIALTDVPNNRTTKWTLAMLLRTRGDKDNRRYVPKREWANRLHKAAVLEVVHHLMVGYKKEQEEEVLAEQAKLTKEGTDLVTVQTAQG